MMTPPGEDPLAIEDGPAAGHAPAPLALPAALAVGEAAAGVDLGELVRPIAWQGWTVRFDGWSHQSGVLRAYVRCTNTMHVACFRYMQVNQLGRQAEVVANLLGWAELGDGISRADHQSRACVPAAARTQAIIAELGL